MSHHKHFGDKKVAAKVAVIDADKAAKTAALTAKLARDNAYTALLVLSTLDTNIVAVSNAVDAVYVTYRIQ